MQRQSFARQLRHSFKKWLQNHVKQSSKYDYFYQWFHLLVKCLKSNFLIFFLWGWVKDFKWKTISTFMG